jgi:hypothetical protein
LGFVPAHLLSIHGRCPSPGGTQCCSKKCRRQCSLACGDPFEVPPESAASILCRGERAGALRLLDGDAGPHIIVAPASLLENWQRELARWCPALKVVPYFGAARIDLRDELEHWRCAACIRPGLP